MHHHTNIARQLCMMAHSCDPYSLWPRTSCEDTNTFFREYPTTSTCIGAHLKELFNATIELFNNHLHFANAFPPQIGLHQAVFGRPNQVSTAPQPIEFAPKV